MNSEEMYKEFFELKQEMFKMQQEMLKMQQELHKNNLMLTASCPAFSEEQRKNALYELAQIKEQEAEVKLNSFII